MTRKGRGTVVLRKDGRYQVSYSDGKRRRFLYRKTLDDANAALADALSSLAKGTYIEPTSTTVSAWLETWLSDYAAPSVRPKTLEGYRGTVRRYIVPTIGKQKLVDLKPSHVQRMQLDLLKRVSPRTTAYARTVLRAALKQAMVEGLIGRNVADLVKPPKQTKHTVRVLAVEEQKALLEAMSGERLAPVFTFMLGTGLRTGETLALRWADVDLRKHVLRVARSASRVVMEDGKSVIVVQEPKTSHGRRAVPLSETVVATLTQWRAAQNSERLVCGPAWENTGLVFTTPIGKMLDQRNLARLLHNLAEKAGLEHINLHALRHTFATRLLEANVHPKIVQEILGHGSITLTLDTYSHVMPDQKQAAVDLIDTALKTM